MSYGVATMKKLKSASLTRIEKHNQRENDDYANKEIDQTKSYLNYDVVNDEPINFRERVMNHINETKSSKRAVRKDATVVNEWIIGSDSEFFEGLNSDETRRYFEVASQYFKDKCGSENVVYGDVHLDEATPHMHLGIVPMIDGTNSKGEPVRKLSGKDMFNRKNLREIQEEFPQYMQDHGFDIERGMEGSKRKKLSSPEYKAMRDEIKDMKHELKANKEEQALIHDETVNSFTSMYPDATIDGIPFTIQNGRRGPRPNPEATSILDSLSLNTLRSNQKWFNKMQQEANKKAVDEALQKAKKEAIEEAKTKANKQVEKILEAGRRQAQQIKDDAINEGGEYLGSVSKYLDSAETFKNVTFDYYKSVKKDEANPADVVLEDVEQYRKVVAKDTNMYPEQITNDDVVSHAYKHSTVAKSRETLRRSTEAYKAKHRRLAPNKNTPNKGYQMGD